MSETNAPLAEHRIQDGIAVCLGDQLSKCHVYPDCECEYWDVDEETGRHAHPDVPHEECWVLPWLNSGDLEDSATDEAAERRLDQRFPDGRISWEWEGEFVIWSYDDDPGLDVGNAHSKCMEAGHHICAEPSGRACDVRDCQEPAGTLWGPYWCPQHDKERLDRVSAGFALIEAALAEGQR